MPVVIGRITKDVEMTYVGECGRCGLKLRFMQHELHPRVSVKQWGNVATCPECKQPVYPKEEARRCVPTDVLAQEAFYFAHPGKGPQSSLMDAQAHPTPAQEGQ